MPRQGKAAELARWLDAHRPECIGEPEFARLREALGPISESYLRKLLRSCGTPLDIMIDGVRQGTLDELEASLRGLWEAYEHGGPSRRAAVRRLVITAKDHARLAARIPTKRAEKEEMILWMTVWLENPPVFQEWLRVRRKRPNSG
jgi:hypothetical protein